MPGLSQLKQFSTEIMNLGNEVEIRRSRGERISVVPIPADAADIDDSSDFINGVEQASSSSSDSSVQENPVEDIPIDLDLPSVGDVDEGDSDFSDLLSPDIDINLDDIDLSGFDESPSQENSNSNESIETSESLMDLDDIPSMPDEFNFDDIENAGQSISEENESLDNNPLDLEDFSLPEDNNIETSDIFDANNLDSDISLEDSNTEVDVSDENNDNSLDLQSFDLDSVSQEENSAEEIDFNLPEMDSLESFSSEDEPSPDLDAFNTDGLDTLDDSEIQAQDGSAENNNAPTDSSLDLDSLDLDNNNDSNPLDSLDFDMPDLDNLQNQSSNDVPLDVPDFDGIDSDVPSPDMEVPDENENLETFDTSAMDNVDFSNDFGDGLDNFTLESTDFELGDYNNTEDDDIFHIPGFSDTTSSVDIRKTPEIETPDFEGAATSGKKPKNSFTDAEYKQFQKNFAEYPLNVRLALEDLVVKNEFTDEVVFSILEKVLRMVPARQLATELEKLLDISLDVPRDYERRTASEYEAYKKSVEYQIKNKILPVAFLTAVAAVFVFICFNLINHFIYRPLKANSLYKQGYVLIQEQQYPQSVDLFNEALTYDPVKKWFYTYAEGYRNHRQYDRARMMYKAILSRYKHEKAAGMAWANMEINDTYNYEEAERIIKREILDYYINDADAILLLGDMYLDWAENTDDPSKLLLAKQQYDLLNELYGRTAKRDTYLARQMRYYIRTDDLRQVLQYKEYFYTKPKNVLDCKDLTELSGYMLDKRYGTLRPSEQSLRFSIEDVRGLLESAVKADQSNPVALYNMGRYFVETNNNSAAAAYLTAAKNAFDAQTNRSKSETYKYINNFRLLGEQYIQQKEYILAEETYGRGLDLFEKVNAESGFASDENVGKLYADMADLDYYISGDLDYALENYKNSVNCKNDTSAVRYKIGFIQYSNKNYSEALSSFIKSYENNGNDTHLLLALANTLSLRNDNYAAQGYYEKLLDVLEGEIQLHSVLLPQVREDQADLVDTYMKATNNLGVTLSRLTDLTGNSQLNAKAIVNLQESLRAWDALTRNQTTLIRLDGSNLAEQNIKYIIEPYSEYKPEIYTQIPRKLENEEGLN